MNGLDGFTDRTRERLVVQDTNPENLSPSDRIILATERVVTLLTLARSPSVFPDRYFLDPEMQVGLLDWTDEHADLIDLSVRMSRRIGGYMLPRPADMRRLEELEACAEAGMSHLPATIEPSEVQ